MAWTNMTLNSGDVVNTPHGQGVVRTVSGAGYSQVSVGGQLYEVANSDITKAEPTSEPAEQAKSTTLTRADMKPGTKVKRVRGGETGTITKETQRSFTVKFDDGTQGTWPKRDAEQNGSFEKVEGHTFKVGDKVRAIDESHSWGGVKKGDEGVIVSVNGDSILADFEGQKSWHGAPKDFEKIEASSPFKAGDQVRNKRTGEIDTVQSVPGDPSYDMHNFSDAENGMTLKGSRWEYQKNWEKVEEEQPEEQTSEPTSEQHAQEQTTVAQTGDGLAEILQLKSYLEKKIDDSVDEELGELKALAKKNQKLEVKVGEKSHVISGLKHKQLEQLINYAALRLSPLLVGMAGTGKTHAGEQTAVALGLEFYSMSVGAQTSKSDIMGYMDASGKYVTTHFRKAYENGGVFLMDEIDAGNANVLITINAALSNGLCAFPDSMVKRHEDFVFIASANTFGNGANRQYVGRNQLDAATLDRFAVIEWFIDDELEENLSFGAYGSAWYMAVKAARDYVAEKSIRALISPRATQKGSKLLDIGQPVDEVINATMLGSVPEDKKADVKQVATTVFEKYASVVKSQLDPKVNPPSVEELLAKI